MSASVVQARIFFSGAVQGVGFRYTTRQVAAQAGLKGWVKNLPDGRVEARLEGRKDHIEDLCRQLQLHYDASLCSTDITFHSPDHSFENFRIIH